MGSIPKLITKIYFKVTQNDRVPRTFNLTSFYNAILLNSRTGSQSIVYNTSGATFEHYCKLHRSKMTKYGKKIKFW